MLKLKLQYLGHLMRRTDSLENTLMLGKIEGKRRRVDRGRDGWMASTTWWTRVWVNSRRWWGTGKQGVLQSTGSQRVRHDWATELNWTVSLNYLSRSQMANWQQYNLFYSTSITVKHMLTWISINTMEFVLFDINIEVLKVNVLNHGF